MLFIVIVIVLLFISVLICHLPSLPLQEQRVRLRSNHRTPPQLFPQLPCQRPASVMSVSGAGAPHPHANQAVVQQEVRPEQRLAAQRESLVGCDETAQTGRQGGASGPQRAGLDDMESGHTRPCFCRRRSDQSSILANEVS